MVNTARKIGINIRRRMLEINLSPDKCAEYLGYSIKDMWNVIEGKVIVPPVELVKIANVLGTTKGNLLNQESENLIPDLSYTKGFSNPDSLDKVLDLIDDYVELREEL